MGTSGKQEGGRRGGKGVRVLVQRCQALVSVGPQTPSISSSTGSNAEYGRRCACGRRCVCGGGGEEEAEAPAARNGRDGDRMSTYRRVSSPLLEPRRRCCCRCLCCRRARAVGGAAGTGGGGGGGGLRPKGIAADGTRLLFGRGGAAHLLPTRSDGSGAVGCTTTRRRCSPVPPRGEPCGWGGHACCGATGVNGGFVSDAPSPLLPTGHAGAVPPPPPPRARPLTRQNKTLRWSWHTSFLRLMSRRESRLYRLGAFWAAGSGGAGAGSLSAGWKAIVTECIGGGERGDDREGIACAP